MNRKKLNLDWKVGYAENQDSVPENWVNAKVPGAVQLDWANANNYGDYKIADNYKKFQWMEDKYWIYKTKVIFDQIDPNKKYYFISKGIDYEFEIFLNDKSIFYQEGMYKHVILDLTEMLKSSNDLLIKIYPVPKTHYQPIDHHQASQSCKPPASYGWDWHPRLIPLGIWDETYIECRSAKNIQNFTTSYTLSEDLKSVKLNISSDAINCSGLNYKLELVSPNTEIEKIEGIIKNDCLDIKIDVDNPMLWYPTGYGNQNLYICKIEIFDGQRIMDSESKKIGFRRVKLEMNEGSWIEPKNFPKTRSVPPMQMVVNGLKIFCKGSNWVMPEIFYGTITEKRYREMLDLVLACNFNILRIWGGAIINKESFFDYCDEMGILIWQEFPLACTNYYDSEKYLQVLNSEAKAIIERVKQHPSLAMWCGGNELFNFWSGMTDQSLALRLLNKLCYELDPLTPFIPASPIMGVGHGTYLFFEYETGKSVFQLYTKNKFTAMTEYGVPAAPNVELLKEFIPEEELWPPSSNSSWKDHHAFMAWDNNEETWLGIKTIEKYFGKQNNIEELVDNSQQLQAVGLQFIFEESRRQQPYCSMTINWCFNDCWPSAANTSIISYPNVPKKAFTNVKNACRPILASARISKFVWNIGEEFKAELFLLNDSMDKVNTGCIRVFFQTDDSQIEIYEWKYNEVHAQNNLAGPTVSSKIPITQNKTMKLILIDSDNPSYNSEYLILIDN